MRSIQTSVTFPLSAVKPLDQLQAYRAFCTQTTARVLANGPVRRRQRCPVDAQQMVSYGSVADGVSYVRCPGCQSLFLEQLPDSSVWSRLLDEVSRFRQAPNGFHAALAQSRTDTVYAPKLDWIQDTLRLQHLTRPRILEVVVGPSPFTQLLRESGLGQVVVTDDASAVLASPPAAADASAEVVILLELLDAVDDPVALLKAAFRRLVKDGVLFVTALVASGFDMASLGARNLYLCPPDRTNCFSLRGLSSLLTRAGFQLVEVSTPGVLDVEIVHAHLRQDPSVELSPFERQVIESEGETRQAFQAFLQTQGLSSFARLVGRKP